MIKFIVKTCLIIFVYIFSTCKFSYAQNIQDIIIKGNERISNETILIFSSISKSDEISTSKLIIF